MLKYLAAMAILLAGMIAGPVAQAQDAGGFWTQSSKRISDYLDEGWKIVSHTRDDYGSGATAGSEFSFVLSKDNKSVLCFVWSQTKKPTESWCRILN